MGRRLKTVKTQLVVDDLADGGRILTGGEQRQRHANRGMLSVGLWAHLHNLAGDALKGDRKALGEFQQAIQYAPPEYKEDLLVFIQNGGCRPERVSSPQVEDEVQDAPEEIDWDFV